MHCVYIIHSEALDRFYVGETHDVLLRIDRHNSNYYQNKWTAKGKPWTLFLFIQCFDKHQALKIEKHIKKMKSKTYIQNLKKYPEMTSKLLNRYPPKDNSESVCR